MKIQDTKCPDTIVSNIINAKAKRRQFRSTHETLPHNRRPIDPSTKCRTLFVFHSLCVFLLLCPILFCRLFAFSFFFQRIKGYSILTNFRKYSFEGDTVISYKMDCRLICFGFGSKGSQTFCSYHEKLNDKKVVSHVGG